MHAYITFSLRYVTLHYIHTYTHIHIYTYTHMCIYTSYTHIHIHTYIHIHIYTYTHIHIYTCSWIVFTSIIYYNIFHTIRSRTSRGGGWTFCHATFEDWLHRLHRYYGHYGVCLSRWWHKTQQPCSSGHFTVCEVKWSTNNSNGFYIITFPY